MLELFVRPALPSITLATVTLVCNDLGPLLVCGSCRVAELEGFDLAVRLHENNVSRTGCGLHRFKPQ